MVQVYTEPLCRRHYGGLLSAPACLRAAVLLGAIALSLVVAFATGGFWRKAEWDTLQPAVHYTGDGVAIFEGLQPGDEQVWASSPALQDALGGAAALASVQVAELDANGDGVPDAVHFVAQLPSAGPAVHSVKLLLQFRYELRGGGLHVPSYALAFLEASSPLPGAALNADGWLELRQAAPLQRQAYESAYDSPLFTAPQSRGAAALQAEGLVDLPGLLARYADRNQTAVFVPSYSVWTAAGSSGGGFTLNVRVRVPPHQLVLYRRVPSLGESLKWGWVQFLATFAAVGWLAAWFEWGVFRLRVLETRVASDVAPRQGPRF
ncbi:hypothetical protein Rsub_11938 [Raphidocelis subcapitata]|uniref:Transmembrane protein 231 n=1 Tax=Raphidocelis subcapitata TaxID=307507 RepID=A0A2V0PKA7_9CHLO|nr:hypothetical protein Rsub_11938 [Raphidocelis subcapitata]|eukprot:GBF99452.1 hypothetical protein Rsub_11938 [Raphidocelis subcapitata]